jgi:hypothetical protein
MGSLKLVLFFPHLSRSNSTEQNLRIFLPTDVPILLLKVFPGRGTITTVLHKPFSAVIRVCSAGMRYIVPLVNYFPLRQG